MSLEDLISTCTKQEYNRIWLRMRVFECANLTDDDFILIKGYIEADPKHNHRVDINKLKEEYEDFQMVKDEYLNRHISDKELFTLLGEHKAKLCIMSLRKIEIDKLRKRRELSRSKKDTKSTNGGTYTH